MVSLSKMKKRDIRPKGNPRPDEPRWKYVLDDDRTPDKDETADYIFEELVEAGRWPMDAVIIEDEIDRSRQHITDALKQYFEIVPEDKEEVAVLDDGGNNSELLDVEPPESVTNEVDYLKGVIRGMWIANSQEK